MCLYVNWTVREQEEPKRESFETQRRILKCRNGNQFAGAAK